MGKIFVNLPGITAKEVNTDDLLAIEDISIPKTKSITITELSAAIGSVQRPVGSLYLNASDATNPSILLGFGKWELYASGRVLVGINSADTDFNTAGKTGGQKDLMAHSHTMGRGNDNNLGTGANQYGWQSVDDKSGAYATSTTGTGVNNMNPYVVVYIWRRTE